MLGRWHVEAHAGPSWHLTARGVPGYAVGVERVVAYVEETVAAALDARAAVERRSRSQVAARILEEALSEREQSAGGVAQRESTAVAEVAGSIPVAARVSESPRVSRSESAFADDHELPWLPALQRRATAKDYEDANFDPEDYQ